MALSVVTSGTKAMTDASLGTETNVESARTTSTAVYQFLLDCSALAAGEVLFIRVYTMVLASGTERLGYFGSFIGGTDLDLLQWTVPITCNSGTAITLRCGLTQKNGTRRSIPWALFSI